MARTTSTTAADVIKTIFREELLRMAQGQLLLHRFAVPEGIPVGDGKTIKFARFLRPAKKTTLKTPGTLVPAGDAGIIGLTANKKLFSLEIVEGTFELDEDVVLTAFPNSQQYQKIYANHMARSVEYWLMNHLVSEALWWRIDKDGTAQVFGTCGANSTATLFHDANRTEADAYWDKAQLSIYNPEGPAYGESSQVTSWLTASDSGTIALDNALTTASKYQLCRLTGLAAGDKITVAALAELAFRHEHLETPSLQGGSYAVLINSFQHADLHTDTDWKAYVQYDRSREVENWKPLRWFGLDFYIGSEILRYDADGTQNLTSGVVHAALSFGADAFASHNFGLKGGHLQNVEWIPVKDADAANLTKSRQWESWKKNCAGGVLNSAFVQCLMTGATDQGFESLG